MSDMPVLSLKQYSCEPEKIKTLSINIYNMHVSSRLKETKRVVRAQAVIKKCELEEIRKVQFPRLIRKQIEPHGDWCGCDLHCLEKDIEKVIEGKNIHADSEWPNSVCIFVGKRAPGLSEETLNTAFVFAGYEGRTKDALRDLLVAATYSDNEGFRGDAFNGLGSLDFSGKLDFFLSRLPDEKLAPYEVCHTIGLELKKHPEETRRVVEELSCILKKSTDVRIRLETAILLINVATKKAKDLVYRMLEKEKDPEVLDSLSANLTQGHSLEFAKKKKLVARMMKQHLKHQQKACIQEYFMYVVPAIQDIESFASLFTQEEQRELIRMGDTEMQTHHYWLGHNYFKAACNHTFMEAEVLGIHFRYMLLPKGVLTKGGKVNKSAIGISEEVPETFRLIIAFHEYVEGLTDSHEKAIKAELLAAQSLGIDKEYIYWATELEGQLFRFSVIDQE